MTMRQCIDCQRIHASRTARCADCARRRNASRDAQRGTRQQRGYGGEYQRARTALLASQPACVRCGQPATTADHIVPLARGGTHDLANLQPMCLRCNSGKGARP